MSLLSHQRSFVYDDMHELMKKRETLGSDEGIDELDMPEEYMMEDFDYVDNITSCNKVFYQIGQSFTQTNRRWLFRA